MVALLHGIIMVLAIFSIIISSSVTVFAGQSDSKNSSLSSQFAENPKSKIQNFVSGVLNDSGVLLNSSSGTFLNSNSNLSSLFLKNNSNLSSNLSSDQIIISNNRIISSINNNSSESNSLVKDKVTTINGVCNSEKIAGNGNDTLFSSGNCNDVLTGGSGSDKFTCGGGNDTIKDFNPKEGDVILDKQNCEKVE